MSILHSPSWLDLARRQQQHMFYKRPGLFGLDIDHWHMFYKRPGLFGLDIDQWHMIYKRPGLFGLDIDH